MKTKIFIDSNVLLYTLGQNALKAERAVSIVDASPCISVQVLNEFTNVARKKLKLDWSVIKIGLMNATANCHVVSMTLETHQRAVEFAEINLLKIYDANIIAAAVLAGCDMLYTEDMNHGQRVGGVLIQNPFK